MIIVFEGIDGSGKDTQIELLLGHLKSIGKTAIKIKFPSNKAKLALSHLNGKITVKPEDLFMDFARDIESSTSEIISANKKYDFVIIDRYIFSTIAYQGVSLGFEKALGLVEKFKIIVPDFVVYLEIGPDAAYARKHAQKAPDAFESDLEFQRKVAAQYEKLRALGYGSRRWVPVDASKPPSDVHRIIIKEIVQK